MLVAVSKLISLVIFPVLLRPKAANLHCSCTGQETESKSDSFDRGLADVAEFCCLHSDFLLGFAPRW